MESLQEVICYQRKKYKICSLQQQEILSASSSLP